MSPLKHCRRLAIAFLISIALNSFLFAVSFSINPRNPVPNSGVQRIVEALSAPSSTFAEWVAPRGHGGAHFVIALIAAVASSVGFYAALAWVILSLPVWWRHRA
jgi:hypothetical protein